jgi:hypothetical protein
MYAVYDVVGLGTAHDLILSAIKCMPSVDDADTMTLTCEELFDC